MADWIREGTAHRSPIRKYPVRHLLVQDRPGEWALWCSSGKGRLDNNPHSRKFCSKCVALAREAIAEEMLDAAEFSGWPMKPKGA